MSEPIQIRPLRDGDESSLLATFETVFGRSRTLESWRWAFRDNPAGTCVQVAARGDRVLAQYAAIPTRVWSDGKAYTFAQVVDSMVHPSERRGLAHRSLFARTAEAFFEQHGGGAGVALFFGWPVAANRRLGERLLGYERLGVQQVLLRGLDGPSVAQPGAVEELDSFDEQAQWLWERCAPDLPISTVRDSRWLTWRYLRHPERRYLILGARDREGVLRGLLVARPAVREGRPLALIADFLVPPGEPHVAERLLAALESRARSWGVQATALWMPPWSPWFGRLQELGFRVHPTAWHLVVRSFEARVDARLLREGWWYQLGDSDLV